MYNRCFESVRQNHQHALLRKNVKYKHIGIIILFTVGELDYYIANNGILKEAIHSHVSSGKNSKFAAKRSHSKLTTIRFVW